MRTLCLVLAVACGLAQAAGPAQRTFATPAAAVEALVAAVRGGQTKAMAELLGEEARPQLRSADAAADRSARERFLRAYEEVHSLEREGENRLVLQLGKDAWRFPFPLVKAGAAWRFDGRAGREEVLNRAIGRNELAAVQACQAYVDAQREYYLANPAQGPLLQYARRIRSSEGKRDGLYYPVKPGEAPSPLGPDYQGTKGTPYNGYHFRVLQAQGPDAPGGAYHYLVNGRMIGGFALVAYPAAYGKSGVMSFIVSHAGVAYEKDLGPDGAAIAARMTRFNPDKSWKRLQE